MTENDRNETAAGENAVDRAEDVRKTRSIRFSDSEWEEVKRAALAHDIPAAEFVRERILALARDPEGSVMTKKCARYLTPAMIASASPKSA